MGIFQKSSPITLFTSDPDKIYSRPFFCKECAEKNRPYAGLSFLVFAGKSQKYRLFTIRKTLFRNSTPYMYPVGFTPHLVSVIIDPHRDNPNTDGKIGIVVSCGIIGCGIRLLRQGKDNTITGFERIKEKKREYWMSIEDVKVLLERSQKLGFKI